METSRKADGPRHPAFADDLSAVGEFRAAQAVVETCMAELDAEGVAYDRDIALGVMIETPAAVFIADELAARARFFSIGTNDLTQYVMAADRGNPRVAHLCDPSDTAVRRTVAMTLAAARSAGIEAGMCGELAADPEATAWLLEAGLEEFSVSAPAVAPLKERIRTLDLPEVRKTAAENGTSKDAPIMDADGVEHPKTIINQISGDSNSGIATLPGKVKFKDLNGDGYITEDDRTVIGNTNPKVQGGFGLSGQWKGFDFAMNFNFMLDFDVNNATAYQLSSSESNKNKFYNVLSTFADKGWRYTRDGDGECLYKCYYIDGSLDMYRELNEGRTLWNPTDVTKKITHSYFIEDGSFLRCQDLTVGYTLPGNLTSKWGISKARFYVSASNLFIITGYSGYDPEVDIQTGLTCGMDYNRYPRSRSFVLGTNITF